MKEICAWPAGYAILVKSTTQIPSPFEFLVEVDGYRFFQTPNGKYAIEE